MEDVQTKLEKLMQHLSSNIFPTKKIECPNNINDKSSMFNFFLVDFIEKNFEQFRNSLKMELLRTYSKFEISKENLINSIPDELQKMKMSKVLSILQTNNKTEQDSINIIGDLTSERKCASLGIEQSRELKKFMFDLNQIKLDVDKSIPNITDILELKNIQKKQDIEHTPQFPKIKPRKEIQSPYHTDKENQTKCRNDKQKEVPQLIERYRSPSPVLINKNKKLLTRSNIDNTNAVNASKGRSTPKSNYTFKTPSKLESASKKATVQHWQY